MAKTVKFKLNLKGLSDLMKSGEMQSALLEAGEVVAKTAGDGFEAEVHTADYIAISNVYANSQEAYRENMKNNTLLTALGSVGLRMSKK